MRLSWRASDRASFGPRFAGMASDTTVSLHWESVMDGATHGNSGYNVILHEFAHVMDFADDGMTRLAAGSLRLYGLRIIDHARSDTSLGHASLKSSTYIDRIAAILTNKLVVISAKKFVKRLPKKPIIEPISGKNSIAYSI